MIDLQALLAEVIEQAEEGNTEFCILLETSNHPDRWMQLTWEYVNAAYPLAEPPLEQLKQRRIPEYPDLELEAWQPNTFATFTHSADELDQIAAFIDAYFERILGVALATADLRVTKEQL